MPGAPSFDHVARQGERRTHESDHGNPVLQVAARQRDRIADIPEVRGVPGIDAVDVGPGTDRPLDFRAVSRDEFQSEPHRLHWQKKVGEYDRRIHIQGIDRLPSDLRS